MNDSKTGPSEPGINSDIFRQIFERQLGDEFGRAEAVFEALGAYHLRSFALLVHHSANQDRLDRNLSAMERILGPDSYLHLVEDPILREVEIKKLFDVIYGDMLRAEPDGQIDFEVVRTMHDEPWPPLIDVIDMAQGNEFTQLTSTTT